MCAEVCNELDFLMITSVSCMLFLRNEIEVRFSNKWGGWEEGADVKMPYFSKPGTELGKRGGKTEVMTVA